MFIRTTVAAVISAGFALATPAFAQETTAETVGAVVNGTDITIGHMIVLRDSLPDQYQNLPDNVLFDGILDQLVQQSILAQTLDEPTPAMKLRLENEQRSLMAGEAMSLAMTDVLTEEAIQAAYNARFANAEANPEYNASHILVETEEDALALIEELSGGAGFADLAKAKSTGPSGPNGGELGWFGPGMMVKPFEDAVVSMKAGTNSAPIQTQFGWHVIRLNEKRLSKGPTLEEVRQDLTQEMQQAAMADVLTELTEGADIVRNDMTSVDPAVLRQSDLVKN